MRHLLRKLLRWAYRALLPARAKNTLRLYVLLDESDKPPQLIETFSADNVLVLAPHMDDEVIGCGGTLHRHVLAGARVTVVFMTDGRRGDPDLYQDSALSAAEIAQAETTLVGRRKQEAHRAAQIIGIRKVVFLDGPDGGLDVTPDLVEALLDDLEATRPDVVYLPSMLDTHLDHWATHRLFHEVTRVFSPSPRWRPVYREYEVWTPLLANRLVDISDVFHVKQEALKQYESQNARIDYVRAAEGLSIYRSIYPQRGRGYAEALFESTPEQYELLFDRFAAKR